MSILRYFCSQGVLSTCWPTPASLAKMQKKESASESHPRSEAAGADVRVRALPWGLGAVLL